MTMTSERAVPVLADFLNNTPTQLTTVTVSLAPYIALARHAAEILSWKSHWTESWLVLASWWFLCIIGDILLRYFLPATVLLGLFLRQWNFPFRPPQPVTEHTLESIITDLEILKSLMPPLSCSEMLSLPPWRIFTRIALMIYIPYLLLTLFIRLRLLVAILGTLILTWRAPWARFIRRTLVHSAHLRWATYRTWELLSGTPHSSITPLVAFSTTSDEDEADTKLTSANKKKRKGREIRFLFTLYENQRWWMGLDWTAALLPAERTPWCTTSLSPAAPPSSFNLPSSTPTARWRWEEPEWRVVIKREGARAGERIEMPLPSEEPVGGSSTSSRLLKAAGKFGQSDASKVGQGQDEGDKDKEKTTGKEQSKDVDEGVLRDRNAEDPLTDPEGWIYGGNKWENLSAKGGLGKYTRYRRWTRVAVVTEVDAFSPSASGDILTDFPKPPRSPLVSPTAITSNPSSNGPIATVTTTTASAERSPTTATAITTSPTRQENRPRISSLRQRLQAVAGVTGLSNDVD